MNVVAGEVNRMKQVIYERCNVGVETPFAHKNQQKNSLMIYDLHVHVMKEINKMFFAIRSGDDV